MATRMQTMKRLAIEEAKKLKKHATSREISNLNKATLISTSLDDCIYGQLTGDCYSKRATDLIVKCCPRVYSTSDKRNGGIEESDRLNSKPTHVKNRDRVYHSAIEVIILHGNLGTQAGEKIIDFLKGETKTLKL